MSPLTLNNPARDRLEQGELSLGVGIRHTRVVDVATMMKTVGMDWLFIDLEHSGIGIDTTSQLSVAALHAGISPIVRIPNGEYALASRALDGGATGIVVPHVESAAEAREIVRQLRFAPLGERGVSGMMPHFGYQRLDVAEATAVLNRSILIVVMLETANAVAQADEIAAVEGVDVVMLGTNDFALSSGCAGQFGSEVVNNAYDTMVAACRAHGKWAGSGGLGNVDHFARCIDIGVQFFLTGGDAGFFMQAAGARVRALREHVTKTPAPVGGEPMGAARIE